MLRRMRDQRFLIISALYQQRTDSKWYDVKTEICRLPRLFVALNINLLITLRISAEETRISIMHFMRRFYGYDYIAREEKGKRGREAEREREREKLARRHASLSDADEGKLAHTRNIARSAFRFRWHAENVNESRSEWHRVSGETLTEISR